MGKGRCPILEFQMQNGEQLGTDPPPSLAKKKKKKGEITKKITKSETDLSKKKLLSQNKATPSTSQTHTHKKKSSHTVSNRKVEYKEH